MVMPRCRVEAPPTTSARWIKHINMIWMIFMVVMTVDSKPSSHYFIETNKGNQYLVEVNQPLTPQELAAGNRHQHGSGVAESNRVPGRRSPSKASPRTGKHPGSSKADELKSMEHHNDYHMENLDSESMELVDFPDPTRGPQAEPRSGEESEGVVQGGLAPRSPRPPPTYPPDSASPEQLNDDDDSVGETSAKDSDDDDIKGETSAKDSDDDDIKGETSAKDSDDDDSKDETSAKDSDDDDIKEETSAKDSDDDDIKDETSAKDSDDDDMKDKTSARDSDDNDIKDETTARDSDDDDIEGETTARDSDDDDIEGETTARDSDDDDNKGETSARAGEEQENLEESTTASNRDIDNSDKTTTESDVEIFHPTAQTAAPFEEVEDVSESPRGRDKSAEKDAGLSRTAEAALQESDSSEDGNASTESSPTSGEQPHDEQRSDDQDQHQSTKFPVDPDFTQAPRDSDSSGSAGDDDNKEDDESFEDDKDVSREMSEEDGDDYFGYPADIHQFGDTMTPDPQNGEPQGHGPHTGSDQTSARSFAYAAAVANAAAPEGDSSQNAPTANPDDDPLSAVLRDPRYQRRRRH